MLRNFLFNIISLPYHRESLVKVCRNIPSLLYIHTDESLLTSLHNLINFDFQS